jgi:hypothetical protein
LRSRQWWLILFSLDWKPPHTMKSKELFTLACRVLGIWQLIEAAEYALTALNIGAGLAAAPASYTFTSYVVQTTGSFFLGLGLLLGAPIIAYFFYPDSSTDETTKEKPADPGTPII